MSNAKAKQIKSIKDLTPDPANVNKGTERGNYQLDWSLTNLGAWRSIAASADGVVAAGNQTLEQAAARGLKIRPVHTKGDELVVVIRDDIPSSDPRFRQYATADNRISETNYSPDAAQLIAHSQAVDLSALYRADELDTLLASVDKRESYGLIEDNEPDGDKTVSNTESERYPLPIVVGLAVLRRWREFKESIDETNDSAAFIQLLESVNA